MHSVTSNGVYNYLMSGSQGNPINDCNLATRNGIWYFVNASNCPPASLGFKASDNSGSLYVQAFDSNYICQIAQDYYDAGALYIRSRKGGIWSNWSRVSANATWEHLITLDSYSYIIGKRIGNDKYIHCHFDAFHINPLSVGQVIASNLPSSYRPSKVIRGLVDLDISTGRIPVVIQFNSNGDVVVYPMSQTQSSGSFGDCYFYGDLLLLVV